MGGLGWRTLGFSLLLLSVIVGGANSTLNGLRMGVLRKSRRSKGRQQEEEEDEAEEVERRRMRRERAERETMALASGPSYSSAQALPPPSAYGAFSPHHLDPYGFQRNPPFCIVDQPSSPSSRTTAAIRARGRNPLYAVPRAGLQNDDASEGWVDED